MASKLVGNYFVKPTATACVRAWHLCGNHMREYQKLRRHAFKLAYWPDGSTGDAGSADLDWDWIKGLEKLRIGELRIDEKINGHDNVRVIFFKANKVMDGDKLLRIWLLTAYQKKRQGFTTPELSSFKARRRIIVSREYGNAQDV
jgi:hypothetical protein